MIDTSKQRALPPDIELVRELSLLFGPSGFEGEVADFIEKKIYLNYSLTITPIVLFI